MQRRDWMRLALATTLAGRVPRWAWANPRLPGNPFGMGVASGSPAPDGMVLWTRLLGEDGRALAGVGEVTLRWELAADEGFRRIVQHGETTALPQLAHAVHVEISGLPPDRPFWYRFMADSAISPVGRTRSLPAHDSQPARLRLGLASCQRWEHGHYAAWRHLREQDPDLVVFVGDYIYEYAGARKGVRTHDQPLCRTLEQYRDRYALYRSDPLLQAMHAHCPWLLTWDDHEVANDYAGLQDESLSPDFPVRRAAAYQAYYEAMPLRASTLVAGAQAPSGLRIHDRVRYGRLASFHLLDDRQYRDPQACQKDGRGGSRVLRSDHCADLAVPSRSLLGAAQEAWLAEGFAQDRASGAQWCVIAQQTAFTPRDFAPEGAAAVGSDAWDGYPAARQRLLDDLQRHAPRNPVILGGDIHMHWVADVHARPERPDTPVVAAEFTGTSISSQNGTSPARIAQMRARNPHARFAASDKRGYVLCELGPRRWDTRLYGVEDVGRPDAAVSLQAAFVVEDGRAGVQPA